MPITSSEIEFRMSGGAANSTPSACLGGAKSSTSFTSGTDNNIFDDVSPSEAAQSGGYTDYRGGYVHNADPSLTLIDARIYVPTNTPAADTTIEIGIAAEAVNTTMATIANENAAPAGVTFSAPSSYATGLQLNGSTGIPAGQAKGFWMKRVISEGAAPATADSFTIRCEGQTT